MREVADLCVNCKMCAHGVPGAREDPEADAGGKAANVAEHGLDRADWVLARTESFAAWAAPWRRWSTALLANPVARWLLEKLFGVSRQRRLPTFAAAASCAWRSSAAGRGEPRSARPRVAYFVDSSPTTTTR